MLLRRYSGQEDFLIGTPIANRRHQELERLIGFFVNTLVMRSCARGTSTVRTFLSRVRETALQAYAHQDLPFEMLVEALQPERDLSRTALFQVMFVLQNAPLGEKIDGDFRVEPLPLETRHAKFDLTLQVTETEDGPLACQLEYSTDLFERSSIERMAAHFVRLLYLMTADPNAGIDNLDLLSDTEQRQLRVDWNPQPQPPAVLPCIHRGFEGQAQATPDAVAITCERPPGLLRRAERKSQSTRALPQNARGRARVSWSASSWPGPTRYSSPYWPSSRPAARICL